MTLEADRFGEFFEAVYGYGPFPWQERLAKRVFTGEWPRAIALPTAAGKTACIDIAVFSLACGAESAARRIFFVVDRRIVVDQAFEHAKQLAAQLAGAKKGILSEVGKALRAIAHDERPLDVYALRGGMYRETAWARSPIQPTVITSTVDQVGSRLLFRGYGVSDSMKPIHAGLVGNDSIILLDEAHCARPFGQTVEAVERYRKWGEGDRRPFHFVSITATPANEVLEKQIIRDNGEDRKHEVLGERIKASKPARLVVAEKAKGKNERVELVKSIEKEAREFAKEFACIGIIVNRVATARALREVLLQEFGDDVVLLTGRMRPLDRDRLLATKLAPVVSNSKAPGHPPKFVIGTQCLECGADFDFHALVTECASLDALRQRFGRLNRVAKRPTAKASIVIRADETEDTSEEPIYGKSLAATWKFLRGADARTVFDFGIEAVRKALKDVPFDKLSELNALAKDAPVLLPAHVDCWVQTHPRPHPDPDPAVFLHGGNQSAPSDVHVILRNDISADWTDDEIGRMWDRCFVGASNQDRLTSAGTKRSDIWKTAVGLCPPSSSEALPVPIHVFKGWLSGESPKDESSDVEGETGGSEGNAPEGAARIALRWKGRDSSESSIVTDAREVRSGDTFIVSTKSSSVTDLGDFFPTPPADYAEEAFLRSRDKAIVRLPEFSVGEEDVDFENQVDAVIESKIGLLSLKWATDCQSQVPLIIRLLTSRKTRSIERHPIGGYVISNDKRLHQFDPMFLEDSELLESPRGIRPVSLDEHSRGVTHFANLFAATCGLNAGIYSAAGLFHDVGKLDPRFQALLKGRSPRTIGSDALAKSGTFGVADRSIHRYPSGGRHELLSAAMMMTVSDGDLLLHLIATHHGAGRPFSPCVLENEDIAKPFSCTVFGQSFSLDSSGQLTAEWNAILSERFWRVVRKYGWWGTAYHEAVFRLADHAQSRAEQECEKTSYPEQKACLTPFERSYKPQYSIALSGLSGSNPLAFLTALGTLRLANVLTKGHARLSWEANGERGVAALHLDSPMGGAECSEWIAKSLIADLARHESSMTLEWMSGKVDGLRQAMSRVAESSKPDQRDVLDWATALFSEIAPEATSQLMMVRRDYVKGNFEGVLRLTTSEHIHRALFETWDYADGLDNQSLHWEPTEDRRHAYQWHQPSGDPTRKKRGGMLGANRLALEAWPLFMSFAFGEKLSTRGFSGVRVGEVRWTWPLWSRPLSLDAVGSLLAAPVLQDKEPRIEELRSLGIYQAMRCSRILVGKTPNLTQSYAV